MPNLTDAELARDLHERYRRAQMATQDQVVEDFAFAAQTTFVEAALEIRHGFFAIEQMLRRRHDPLWQEARRIWYLRHEDSWDEAMLQLRRYGFSELRARIALQSDSPAVVYQYLQQDSFSPQGGSSRGSIRVPEENIQTLRLLGVDESWDLTAGARLTTTSGEEYILTGDLRWERVREDTAQISAWDHLLDET